MIQSAVFFSKRSDERRDGGTAKIVPTFYAIIEMILHLFLTKYEQNCDIAFDAIIFYYIS